jgi:tetratricopeptide (TPR) repeat protein
MRRSSGLELRNKHAFRRVKAGAPPFSAEVRAVLVLGILGVFLASACARGRGGKPIEFVEDDYPRALAEARSRGVRLFVDAWAPWCHTCLSMRAYVFPDPSLRRYASSFVWLSLDTERANNAAIVEKLGVHELPTMYVIDPKDEATAIAWPGSLTAAELAKLLDEQLAASSRSDTADVALRRGHKATAEGRSDEAIDRYRAALAAAPPDWSARAEAQDALVAALGSARRSEDCAREAAGIAPTMPPGTALADVLRKGLECAIGAGGPSPADAGEARRTLLSDLTALGERASADRAQPILADDRSDLFDHVESGWEALDRPDDARRVARAWAAFLEDEASRAPSPAARVVFDSHRLAAYLALGEAERAIPMLEQSARDFPEDYNPPARLGRALLALHRPDEAIAALERALRLAYGPRKLNLWSTEADAYLAKGDREGARRVLENALAFADKNPMPGGYAALRASLASRLAGLSAR